MIRCSNIIYNIQIQIIIMKDRWKIFWTCVVLSCVLAIILGTVTASFKKVELRQYGILYYTIFNKVQVQTARANGNYLIGFDYGFHKFPSGIIPIQFNTMTLTKDMSMVQVEGLFTGRLIRTEVTSMYQNYGNEYLEFLKASVEQYTRQAIQTYSLNQIISNRQGVENNVKEFVCLQIQTQYTWVQCDYVSLGRVGANIPQPQIIAVDQSFQQKKVELLSKQIQSQKKLNFYQSGGFQILQSLQNLNSQLFYNVTNLIAIAMGTANQTFKSEIASAARYYVESANFPTLSNSLSLKI